MTRVRRSSQRRSGSSCYAILWQLRKRKLQREGRPLTAAIKLPDTED